MTTVYPESTAALAAAVRAAQGHPIAPVGAGTKAHWGGQLQSDRPVVTLSTLKLNRVVAWAAADLTVTVEAGMLLADLQRELASQGQFIPLDPPFADRATVGGVLATGTGGSLRHRYHGIRDMVLGVTMVRADGEVVKAGGRVVKNVAGYDLMKLLAGSWGTLGVVTELTLRVYPLPTQTETCLLWGPLAAVADLRDRLMASTLTPVAVEVLSPPLTQALAGPNQWGLAIRLDGVAASTQGDRLRQMASGLELGAIAPDFGRLGKGCGRGPGWSSLGCCRATWRRWGPNCRGCGAWGGAPGWGGWCRKGPGNPCGPCAKTMAALPRNWPATKPATFGRSPGGRALGSPLEQAFDPQGVLNPGRFLPELASP
ncbi:MAG: FAD-binding oxidoreductase [Oscillatoriales cyanobacterium SM2_1_8]|nr:FAD-binding oxidoreductase [Oscillatoriales cyanobacterium SM2_1_8]